MRSQITAVDLRRPAPDVAPTPTTEIPIGAVVAFPAVDGTTRRGVVIGKATDVTSILDGENTVELRGDDRAKITMLAPSTDEYTARVSDTAQTLRTEQGWCSVPNELVRKLNNTPAEGSRLSGRIHVIIEAEQRFILTATDMTLRRSVKLDAAIRDAFRASGLGWFTDNVFHTHSAPSPAFRLKLVDEPTTS